MRPACRWTRSCLRWGCAHGLPAPGLAGQPRKEPGCNPGRVHKNPPLRAACRRCHAGGIAGQRKAPLVQRGDSMATPCRGDCKAGGMIQLVFYCRVREHRLGAAARRQSLSRRSPTAPFAQGSRLCLSASDLPGAAAQFGRPATGPPLWRRGAAAISGGIVKRNKPTS